MYMRAEEIAQSEKLTDFVHGSRRGGFGDGLQLVGPRFDSFFGQSKTWVGDVSKVDLDVVRHQASKQFIEQFDVGLMRCTSRSSM